MNAFNRIVSLSALLIASAATLALSPARAAPAVHYYGDFTTPFVPGLAEGCGIIKAGFVIVSSTGAGGLGQIAAALQTTAQKNGYNAIVSLRFSEAAFPYSNRLMNTAEVIAYGTGETIRCRANVR
ncbi:MAG: hypothetical protein ACRETA_07675 [Gammaproteobacteria bacterium]